MDTQLRPPQEGALESWGGMQMIWANRQKEEGGKKRKCNSGKSNAGFCSRVRIISVQRQAGEQGRSKG